MRFANLDGTALTVDILDGDGMFRATSPLYEGRIEVLLDAGEVAELIVNLLAGRKPPGVYDADQLAARLHAGQPYGEGQYAEPYIVHPRDVANRVQENGPHAVMAALLHDVVEDTPCTLTALTALGYPDEVVDAVDAVTKRDGEEYMEFVRRTARHPLGRIIKLADNASNTAKLGRVEDAERRAYLTDRYERAREVLYLAGRA